MNKATQYSASPKFYKKITHIRLIKVFLTQYNQIRIIWHYSLCNKSLKWFCQCYENAIYTELYKLRCFSNFKSNFVYLCFLILDSILDKAIPTSRIIAKTKIRFTQFTEVNNKKLWSWVQMGQGIQECRLYHLKFFKGCLPQILLDLFLNSLIQMTYMVLKRYYWLIWIESP